MMRKALIKINSPTIKSIINSDITSDYDLYALANKMGIKDVQIKWLNQYNKNEKAPQILNLGSSSVDKAGTHWVCAYDDQYFDSFGMAPPPGLDHLEWTPLQLQDINEGRCGQWCVMFILYKKKGELDKFYSAFNSINTNRKL
jgi:hypothetical protein